MRRICVLSDYCNPDSSAKLRVAPPVFASPTDAWNHFVKHPEDYPLSDDEHYNDSIDRQCDVFDMIDLFQLSSQKSDLSDSVPQPRGHAEVPTSEEHDEPGEERTSEEQPAV